jgi:hypothetical protein
VPGDQVAAAVVAAAAATSARVTVDGYEPDGPLPGAGGSGGRAGAGALGGGGLVSGRGDGTGPLIVHAATSTTYPTSFVEAQWWVGAGAAAAWAASRPLRLQRAGPPACRQPLRAPPPPLPTRRAPARPRARPSSARPAASRAALPFIALNPPPFRLPGGELFKVPLDFRPDPRQVARAKRAAAWKVGRRRRARAPHRRGEGMGAPVGEGGRGRGRAGI